MKYLYTGPNSAITLIVLDKEQMPTDVHVMLWNNTEVDMPESHEATNVLLHQGFLKPVEVAVETKAAEPESVKPKAKA